jgi:hypothetical protein
VKCLFALALAAPVLAQTALPVIPSTLVAPSQTVTTGMIGFTANQTARLNVFNLNSIVSVTSTTNPTPPPNCTVELQFFDNKGAMVSQTTVPNFAAGTSTSFDLTRASVTSETAVRAEIRGVVVINPTVTPAPTTAPGFCTVFTTLEIFDANGSTVSLTSDTRPFGPAGFSGVLFGPVNDARR